ncbi:hypothetical protein C1646_741297 [Rhizophagus diaphanus]|nr:hypothetical protein C1646_741297 [Rhizophagus diaphanus] [Rhizophagus sp. MUCL 43196]
MYQDKFDGAPEDEQDEHDKQIKFDYDDDDDFDDYFEDELNDNEEWDNAKGDNTKLNYSFLLKDFTKQYNRLRQKLQAGGTSSGSIKYQKGPSKGSKGSSLSAGRVEHDHPHALRKDISNVTEYFKRKGVRVMSIRELFDFITDINIGLDDEQVEAELDKIQERLASQQKLSITLNEDIDKMSKDLVDEEVFKKAFIPRTLDDVFDVERDTLKISKGESEDVMVNSENISSISTKDDESEDDDQDEEKEREKESCERSAREKRKNKIPKAVKKRKIKTTTGKKSK